MDSLGLSNVRSFVKTGPVALRRLTILVGANSSGKSTFLRIFPLLKQSVETTTASPLLWYGRYVDFGSIEQVKNLNFPSWPTSFSFSFTFRPEERGPWPRPSMEVIVPLASIDVKATLHIDQSAGRLGSMASGLEIDYGDRTISVEFDQSGKVTRCITGDFDLLSTGISLVASDAAYMLPNIVPVASDTEASRTTQYDQYLRQGDRGLSAFYNLFHGRPRAFLCPAEVAQQLSPYFHGRTKIGARTRIANRLRLGPPGAMVTYMKSLPSAGAHWQSTISDLENDTDRIDNLSDRVLANMLPMLIDHLDLLVAQFASAVQYLGPVRANAERFYRAQDLAVREVDFRGENLAVFLRSLSFDEKVSFTRFAADYFNVVIGETTRAGHVEVRVAESGGPDFNLADTGFGYSQMLPLMAQSWSAIYRKELSPSILAIEQPELHLHPGLQAKVAEMFVGILNNERLKQLGTKIVCETHSEAIINRIGKVIRDGRLLPDDVHVVVFTKDDESRNTIVSTASFDSDGALRDWPFGFFSAELD